MRSLVLGDRAPVFSRTCSSGFAIERVTRTAHSLTNFAQISLVCDTVLLPTALRAHWRSKSVMPRLQKRRCRAELILQTTFHVDTAMYRCARLKVSEFSDRRAPLLAYPKRPIILYLSHLLLSSLILAFLQHITCRLGLGTRQSCSNEVNSLTPFFLPLHSLFSIGLHH